MHRIVLLLLEPLLLELALVQLVTCYTATDRPDNPVMHHMPGSGTRHTAGEAPDGVRGWTGE